MNNSFMENDTFRFDESNKENNNYEMISGLGQSDYENEDLFAFDSANYNPKNEISEEESIDNLNTEKISDQPDVLNVFEPDYLYNFENNLNNQNNDFIFGIPEEEKQEEIVQEESVEEQDEEETIQEELVEEQNEEETAQEELAEEQNEEETVQEELVEEQNEEETAQEELVEDQNEEETAQEELVEEQSELLTNNQISLSDTSLDELNKLTEYVEEKIETTDIKSLFDRVGVNVKEASDIFKKNSEMKEKIDSRFEELKKLQSEVEKAKKNQYDEINSYKEEVLNKLTEKKEEIEKRLNKLKEYQTKLEKEKEEFEAYKKAEKEEIERVQKEIQEAYEGRREELTHIEDILRKQKDALDEERSQLSLDRIQYESDKNELANNLLKFNEIVDSFTNGVDKLNKEEE